MQKEDKADYQQKVKWEIRAVVLAPSVPLLFQNNEYSTVNSGFWVGKPTVDKTKKVNTEKMPTNEWINESELKSN